VEPQFAIENAICKMGKISINLEKHGEEEVIVFAIPITGAMLPAKLQADDPANAIAADPHFTRSIFNDNKGFLEPMQWMRAPICIPEKYEGAQVSIELPSGEVLEFEGARVGDIELMATPGGMVATDYQIQLHPELDRVNLLLQEYQHHEVKITVHDAKVALKKKSKQKELPLQQPPVEERELARSSEAELEAARQREETERQLGEALRGLEREQQSQVDGGEAANESNDSDGESSDEAA
jgi:hypothetical protein